MERRARLRKLLADMDEDEKAEKLGDTCVLLGFCCCCLIMCDVALLTYEIPEAAQHVLRSQT